MEACRMMAKFCTRRFMRELNHNYHGPPFALFSRWISTGSSSVENEVEVIYRILANPPADGDVIASMKKTGIFLSNEVIDGVLKRVRFSHGDPLQALEMFIYTSKKCGFFHTAYSFDTMLYILGRGRKFDVIWDLLADMRRKDRFLITPRTLMVVLARIAKACSVRMTVESFRKFKRYIGELDTGCYNALFRTLAQEKSMGDARNVYHSLKGKFRPNLQTFNILLSGWKSAEDAEVFFAEMIEFGVKPDIVSYNCLIDVYCKSREMEKVYKLVEKMREEEIYPDVFTYTSIIGGLGLIGQPDKAKDILKEMKEHSCYPDVAAYNAVIRNFCIAKRLGVAFELVDEMISKELNPNSTTFNLFFRHFYWANDLNSSWNLYQKMMDNGCLPNTHSCMFLIRLFRKQEKVEMALALWRDMVEKNFGSYTLVSDVLFDLLCDMGKLDDAERCFLEMIDKCHRPSSVAFKRIKILMELANRPEGVRTLSHKMSKFARFPQAQEKQKEFSIPAYLIERYQPFALK